MTKISVVYFTHADATGALVEALIETVKNAGCEIYSHKISGKEIVEGRFYNRDVIDAMKSSDAIVFASPTYMGGPAAQFKSFADATSDCWAKQSFAGKFAAGITCGGAPNGDQSSTLQYFITLANQHGMLWVGLDVAFGNNIADINPLGCQLGVSAVSADEQVEEAYLETAKYLGKRLLKFIDKI